MTSNSFKLLLSMIPEGSGNAVSMDSLSGLLGVTPRIIRQHIHNARCAGHVIAGTDEGYFVPETLPELRRYIRQTERRGRSTFAGLVAARRLLKEWEAAADAE